MDRDPLPDGTTRNDAERELRGVLSDVERVIWQPPRSVPMIDVEVEADPTFHVFSSDWFEAEKRSWRPTTVLDYEWQLTHHLLPFFKDHRLSQVTIAEVDGYRQHKVAEDKLSANVDQQTLVRLGQVLELAVECDLIPRNPVKVEGKRRKVKAVTPRRAYWTGLSRSGRSWPLPSSLT